MSIAWIWSLHDKPDKPLIFFIFSQKTTPKKCLCPSSFPLFFIQNTLNFPPPLFPQIRAAGVELNKTSGQTTEITLHIYSVNTGTLTPHIPKTISIDYHLTTVSISYQHAHWCTLCNVEFWDHFLIDLLHTTAHNMTVGTFRRLRDTFCK